MIGHNKIVISRLSNCPPTQHVLVQICQYMEYYDNPTVQAQSWADVDADWSFLTGLVVEIIIDANVEADRLLAIALAIQKEAPKQLYVTDYERNQYAVFWKDHTHQDVDFIWMWN